MAELVGPKTWEVQGRRITLPVATTDAEVSTAVFRSSVRLAGRVLAGTGLKPLAFGGYAFSVLMLVRYGPWDLGSYDEVGVGVLARGPGGRPGVHVVDLPVTGAFTREAGQDLWALPKWLMGSELAFGDRSASVAVRDGETFVARVRIAAGRLPWPFGTKASVPVWSVLDHGAQAGVLLRGVIPVHVRGLRFGRGSARTVLGDHPMAARMGALGMTRRPLFTVHASHMSAVFDEFDAVG